MKHIRWPIIFLAAVLLLTCAPATFAYAAEAEDVPLIEDGYYYIKALQKGQYD